MSDIRNEFLLVVRRYDDKHIVVTSESLPGLIVGADDLKTALERVVPSMRTMFEAMRLARDNYAPHSVTQMAAFEAALGNDGLSLRSE